MDYRVKQVKDFDSAAATSYYNRNYFGNVGKFVPKVTEEAILTPNHDVFLNLTNLWSYGNDVRVMVSWEESY